MKYDAASIKALSDIEAVKKNINIYTGDDEQTGVWLIIKEAA